MTEDTPTLVWSSQEMFQWAQALSLLRDRLAARRSRQGRLAFDDAEHAARVVDHLAEGVSVRVMSADEEAAWIAAVPSAELDPVRKQGCTTWCAPLDDGGWGLEARTWDSRGAPTGAMFLVCPEQDSAFRLRDHLVESGSPAELERLRRAASEPLPALAGFADATEGADRHGDQPPLTGDQWAAALRRELPVAIAEKLIDTDAQHPHAGPRNQLYRIAASEVERIGAHPDHLARLIATVPRWGGDVRNPPALACWALLQARTDPAYDSLVSGTEIPAKSPAPTPDHGQAPRLDQVDSHQTALAWAQGLRSGDATDRVEAERGWGQFGGDVDAVLATTFPGLVTTADTLRRRRIPEQRTRVLITEQAELREFVRQLDPDKIGDRLSARTMIGRTNPDIDSLLNERFAGDTPFDARIAEHYPAGIEALEAEAAAWRTRAEADIARAAHELGTPDVPDTVQREDIAAREHAATHASAATRETAVAATLTSRRPPAPVRRR